MNKFWYDYVKPKYCEKLCYMDTDFISYIKIDNIYKEITEDVEIRFDTSNYELDRPLPTGKNKSVIGLMKDELDGETYSYLIDEGSEDKNAKDTKKCVIKRKPKFENYKNCLEETQLNNKIKCTEKKLTYIVLKKS